MNWLETEWLNDEGQHSLHLKKGIKFGWTHETSNVVSQKDGPKTWRSIQNHRCDRTSNISIEITNSTANSQCFLCLTAVMIQRKQSLQHKLQQTTSRTHQKWRGLWGWNHSEPPETRQGIPVLRQMARIPNHWSIVGTGKCVFGQQQTATTVQTTMPTMNNSTHETTSLLSLSNHLEEMDWYFQDLFNQFRNIYCCF